MSNEAKVIEVNGLGKDYFLGSNKRQTRLRKFLSNRLFGSLPEQARRSPLPNLRMNDEKFSALQDISFEVAAGEVLGIMGPNGAGKSTLLKILSGITAPSSGRGVVRGRVGALLEVGTGFNYELTGRENIYLNGLMLGMTKSEINRKFDEIVEFSGVEGFLEVPVKRYSSGMITRLGFAVAAHLEPEILIVDEILAVGDAAFQRRCLEKMRNIASYEGRVVLFISHSIEAVMGVCSRAIRLDAGRLVQQGSIHDVVAGYLKSIERDGGDVSLASREDRQGTGELRVARATLRAELDGSGIPDVPLQTALVGHPLSISLTLMPSHDRVRDVTIELIIKDRYRSTVTVLSNSYTGDLFNAVIRSTEIVARLPRCIFTPGRYWIDAVLKAEDRVVDQIDALLSFDVLPAPFFGEQLLQPTTGSIFADQSWAVR